MAVFGYARVSTLEQSLQLQQDALLKFGCDKVFFEKVSGKDLQRIELQKLFAGLRENDVLVVFKLDRLARSLKDLIDLLARLEVLKVDFVSISDGIDTSTAVGKLMFQVVGAFAEFERNIISERTKAGLESARTRGKIGGKPKGLSDSAKKKAVRVKELYDEKILTVQEICRLLEIGSKATFYKYLEFENERKKELNV